MPFAICGVHEVPSFAGVHLDHIISIKDKVQPGPDLTLFRSDFTLHSFVFDDTGDATRANAVTMAAIQRLLAIYRQTTPENRLLFHCYAGVSRSSAAAFLWLVHHGASYEESYQAIVTARGPFVCPNQLMVSLADKAMGRGGEMERFMVRENGRRAPDRDAWFNRHQR